MVRSELAFSWAQARCVNCSCFHGSCIHWGRNTGHLIGRSWECPIIIFCGWRVCLYRCDHFVSILGSSIYNSLTFDYRGEMSSMYPVSGAFSVFGTRFISPALGFTLGEYQCSFDRHPFWWRFLSSRMELLAPMVSVINCVCITDWTHQQIGAFPFVRALAPWNTTIFELRDDSQWINRRCNYTTGMRVRNFF